MSNTYEEKIISESSEKDLQDAILETLKSYNQKSFIQTNINLDPLSEPIYKDLRSKYGEKPNKEQIQDFYNKIGSLNCSLVADWQIADIEEKHPAIKGTKIQLANLPKELDLEPKDEIKKISHAIVQLNLEENTIYYEPSNGKTFTTLEDAGKYYNEIWPQPDTYSFEFAQAY